MLGAWSVQHHHVLQRVDFLRLAHGMSAGTARPHLTSHLTHILNKTAAGCGSHLLELNQVPHCWNVPIIWVACGS